MMAPRRCPGDIEAKERTGNRMSIICIQVETMETPDGHDWKNWRLYLCETAPKILGRSHSFEAVNLSDWRRQQSDALP
jgi:hypothetical protein